MGFAVGLGQLVQLKLDEGDQLKLATLLKSAVLPVAPIPIAPPVDGQIFRSISVKSSVGNTLTVTVAELVELQPVATSV